MDRTDVILFVAVVQLMSAAAESPPDIQCNVTQLDGDLFRYDLSKPPNCTSDCTCSWENRTRTVFAVRHKKAPNVKHLTNRSITLFSCQDFMKFSCNSKVAQEAICTVNCSELSSAYKGGPITVKRPRWFPDPLTIGLIIGAVFVPVIIVIVGYRVLKFCKSEGGPASAEEESKMMANRV